MLLYRIGLIGPNGRPYSISQAYHAAGRGIQLVAVAISGSLHDHKDKIQEIQQS